MLQEGDDQGSDRITDLTVATKIELEAAIVANAKDMRDEDDAQAVLSVAITILREEANADRALALIRAVHWGLNSLRNAREAA